MNRSLLTHLTFRGRKWVLGSTSKYWEPCYHMGYNPHWETAESRLKRRMRRRAATLCILKAILSTSSGISSRTANIVWRIPILKIVIYYIYSYTYKSKLFVAVFFTRTMENLHKLHKNLLKNNGIHGKTLHWFIIFNSFLQMLQRQSQVIFTTSAKPNLC